MIEFNNVWLQYHYDDFAVLKGASFTLREGLNTVLADVQSGKSSICKLLCKEVKLTDGEIIVDGLSLQSITSAHLGILYLPSAPTFFENRSVRFNVEYPLKVRKVARAERRQRVQEIAACLNVDYLNEKVKKLSAEQRKTVALARGMTVKRKVVLFDDFFQFDDDKTLVDMCSVLKLFENATCVILSSDERLAMGNTVVIDGGVTVYEGDADGAASVIDGLQWLSGKIGSE